MAQTHTRKLSPHLSVPGQCPTLSRLEYVLGNKHKSFDTILPPNPPPPPSASLTPSALSSISRPTPLRSHSQLLPSPLIHRPYPSLSAWTATSRTDSTQPTAPSVQEPRPRLSPLPLRYPLTSQSSVYSYDDEDLEQEKSTPIPLHRRPVEEWSATAGVRLADQASTLRRGRELRKANRRLIKDVVSELLNDQCDIEDESEAHIIGTYIVTLVQHCFAEDIDTKPLSLLILVPYVGRYIELLSSPEPPTWNPPHRRPHPPPSSRRLRSADHGLDGHDDTLHLGDLNQVGGVASTSLGTAGRTAKGDMTSRNSSRTETRQLTSQLTEARQPLLDSQLKIQDLEDRCERLQMRVDGYWMEWAAREREVREGLYRSVGEEIASSRASGSRSSPEGSLSSECRSTKTGQQDHDPFEEEGSTASTSSASSSTSATLQIQSPAYSPKAQPSVASYSSEGIIERLLTFPPPSQPPPTPQPPFAYQSSTSTPAPSYLLASSSTPLVDPTIVPVSSAPPRTPSLPPSSTQLSWLSSSPTTASTALPLIQHAPSHPPPPPPNPNPPSPPPSPSTLTFTPAHVRTSPRLLYPLKSCLKLTRPASPPPLPTQSTATTTNAEPNSSPNIDPSPSLKRRRNGLEPVYGFEPTAIVKPEGYKLPGRLVKRVRG